MTGRVEPHLFVIFGGMGDLARRKLIPSLYELLVDKELTNQVAILGVGRREHTDEDYGAFARQSLAEAGIAAEQADQWPPRRSSQRQPVRTWRNTATGQ